MLYFDNYQIFKKKTELIYCEIIKIIVDDVLKCVLKTFICQIATLWLSNVKR